MREIQALFNTLDQDGSTLISLEEFVRGVKGIDMIPDHRLKGPGLPADCDLAAIFKHLDDDGDGRLDVEELCLAIGADLLAAKERGVTAPACLMKVLTTIQPSGSESEEPTRPGGAGPDEDLVDADICAPGSPGEYICAAFPFTLACYSHWGIESAEDRIVGLPRLLEYVGRVKECDVHYRWNVRCYHYETRTRQVADTYTDMDGNTTTTWRTEHYQEAVTTHSASTSGSLVAQDFSSTFVPRKWRKNLLLKSQEHIVLDPSFERAYHSRRSRFYSANRRDTHQSTSASLSVPALVVDQHFQWVRLVPSPHQTLLRSTWRCCAQVEGELPCWLSCPVRFLASLVAPACGPCWLCQAKRHLDLQTFTFSKRCSGFRTSG